MLATYPPGKLSVRFTILILMLLTIVACQESSTPETAVEPAAPSIIQNGSTVQEERAFESVNPETRFSEAPELTLVTVDTDLRDFGHINPETRYANAGQDGAPATSETVENPESRSFDHMNPETRFTNPDTNE